MTALPPVRRKHRICVICEGYEDYHYFNRLIALNLWDASCRQIQALLLEMDGRIYRTHMPQVLGI